jgi:hypothetical protein
MGNSILRDGTNEEKLARADKALMQLERRINMRSIVAPLTPIVIVGYSEKDDNGVIARGMIPLSGFITKVSLFIDRLDDEAFLRSNALEFYIEIRQADGTITSKKFLSKRLDISTLSNFKIAADSRLIVSINTKATGIYWGFIMEPETPIKRKVDVADTDLLGSVELAMIEQ